MIQAQENKNQGLSPFRSTRLQRILKEIILCCNVALRGQWSLEMSYGIICNWSQVCIQNGRKGKVMSESHEESMKPCTIQCEKKISQHVNSNAIICVDQVFAVKNLGLHIISCQTSASCLITVLEHLKTGLGCNLARLCWPATWAVITSIWYSLHSNLSPGQPLNWPRSFLNCQ